MMSRAINKDYKKSYETVFKDLLSRTPQGTYDESALPSYTHANRLMSWLFWNRIRAALSLAGDLKGQSVLDFGCGGGVTFKYFHQLGCEIAGCDNLSHAVAEDICRKFDLKASIYRELDDIRGKTFDTIFALDVLEHINNLEPILKRFAAVSHKRTKIILSGPTENLLYKAGRLLAGFSGHYHVRNIYQIERMFQSHGLKRTGIRSLYFPLTLFRVTSWEMNGSHDNAS